MKSYCNTDRLSIRKIDKASAKKMVVKYHYSHLWTKCSVALGLFYDTGKQHAFFDEAEEKMIGVIVYGDPVGRNSGSSIAEGLEHTQVYELARLYIHDGYGCNIESWFISQSMDWLKNNFSHILALISYASPMEGHVGTIYQATNWLYQGNSLRWNDGWLFKFEEDGRWIHGRTIFPHYKTNDPQEIRKKVTSAFWVKKELRKHRYVYILAGKKEKKRILNNLKHPTFPYPKTSDIETTEEVRLEPI